MMTLESFAAELKKNRIDKQVSLMDISAATRINLKFLEALEEGNFAMLPQTYVRAFIREYADAVGLDPKSMLKKYEAIHHPKQSSEKEKDTHPASPAKPSSPAAQQDGSLKPVLAFAKQNALFVGFVLVVAVFVVYLFRQTSDVNTPSTIAETPFDNVVRENAAAQPPEETPVSLPAVTRPAAVDSLSLVMTTTDSVWMTITLDDARTLEYLFPPGRRGSWTAKESFTLTMGNAGGAAFVLNGKDLGSLGRPGAVIRNVRVSAANLNTP
ncbi:MAG: helix-turn-helix domain-containing protein [Bacteroidota bacterium]